MFTERTGPCHALIRYLPTANNRKMRRNNREVESILREIIGKRIQAMERGEGTKDDMLGLLLETNMRDDMGMTIEDVIEECKVFYFAGMETTSVLLTWTMVVLSMHPEWQDRAREEVTALFGRDGKPEYDGLSRLKVVSTADYFFRSFIQITLVPFVSSSVRVRAERPMDE
jgi:cytochrome P450